MYKYLDHFIISDRLSQSLTDEAIRFDADNLSDHNAITCKLGIELVLTSSVNDYEENGFILKWDRCTADDINTYCHELDCILDNICVPFNHGDPHCNDRSHKLEITAYYNSIMNSIRYAAGYLPKVKKGIEREWWNSDVKKARDESIEAYKLWLDNGMAQYSLKKIALN